MFNVAAQYGLPPVLAALGVPECTALVAGSASYAIALAAGCYLGV